MKDLNMGCRKLEIEDYYRLDKNPLGSKKSLRRFFSKVQKHAKADFYTVISNQRYYNSNLGCWTKRDPIQEQGGFNLYAMVRNNPVDEWDILGLSAWEDSIALALATAYLARAVNPIGIIANRFFKNKTIPSLEKATEVKAIVSKQMKNFINEICSKSPGTHQLNPYNDSVTFRTAILGAILQTGSIYGKGKGIIKTVSKKTCQSCKQYSIDVDWKYFDQIDANSFAELSKKGFFQKGSGVSTKLLGVLEGMTDLSYDKVLAANFNVISNWKKSKKGCCPSN
jgi:RHS repeat-associated protein